MDRANMARFFYKLINLNYEYEVRNQFTKHLFGAKKNLNSSFFQSVLFSKLSRSSNKKLVMCKKINIGSQALGFKGFYHELRKSINL